MIMSFNYKLRVRDKIIYLLVFLYFLDKGLQREIWRIDIESSF